MNVEMLGTRIRVVREMMDVSQTELARRLGVNKATISRWESEDVDITAKAIRRLAEALGVTPSVFGREEEWMELARAFSALHDILKKGAQSRVTNQAQSEPPSTLSANYHSVKRILQPVIPSATRRTASIPR